MVGAPVERRGAQRDGRGATLLECGQRVSRCSVSPHAELSGSECDGPPKLYPHKTRRPCRRRLPSTNLSVADSPLLEKNGPPVFFYFCPPHVLSAPALDINYAGNFENYVEK